MSKSTKGLCEWVKENEGSYESLVSVDLDNFLLGNCVDKRILNEICGSKHADCQARSLVGSTYIVCDIMDI